MIIFKITAIYLKMLPLYFTIAFFIFLTMVFTSSIFIFSMHYNYTVLNNTFSESFLNYMIFFFPVTLFFLVIVDLLFLKKINTLKNFFFTEYIVKGYLPAKLRQLKASFKIFNNFFKTNREYSKNYFAFKNDLKRISWIFRLFDFQNIFIAYCAARNDRNVSTSSSFLKEYFINYKLFFIRKKIILSSIKIFWILVLAFIGALIFLEFVPNYFRFDDYLIIHLITGSMVGFFIYTFFFLLILDSWEIIFCLNFLKDKNIPGEPKDLKT